MVKRYWLAVLVLPWLSAGAGAQDGEMAYPAAKVEVATAQLRDMAPTSNVSGNVVSLNDARVATEVEGVLVELANVGDAVKKGDVIASIDPHRMRIAQRSARAQVARMESDLAYSEQQLVRAEKLAADNNAPAYFIDESINLRDQAKYSLLDAKAQLDAADRDLARTTIRAAFTGHVTARLAAVGEYLAVGEDVLRLVDTQHMAITMRAPIALAAFVSAGQSVAVRASNGERQHTVQVVVPVGDAVSRMVEVRLDVAAGDYLVGTPVQVSLPSATPVSTIAVPRDALVERGGEVLIYKVAADGTAVQIKANITSTVGLWVGVADGVAAGDKVVVRGAERLGPGQSVEVIAGSSR